MKRYYFCLAIFILSLMVYGFNTEYEVVDPISDEWQIAGYPGQVLPDAEPANTFYAGTSDNIQDVIDYARIHSGQNGNCIVRVELEPGEYEINSHLTMYSNIILSGNHMFRRDVDRTERTILKFDITEVGPPPDYEPHNTFNCIHVKTYEVNIYNEPIKIYNVGIEDLLIERIDEGSSNHNEKSYEGNNIEFDYAENCWVYGVESINPIKHHIHIGESNNISVKGCYLHGAQFHGEGGYGYGVIAEYGSTHCLVENNIFNDLRHAMLVQNDAHWNVFGYNYVSKANQSTLDNLEFDDCPPWLEDFLGWLAGTCIPGDFVADICCHGESSYEASLPAGDGYRGPYENLFEGNICNTMWVDSFHGKNKKFNTFFRNRAGKYGFSVFDKLHDALSDRYYTRRQTEQIAIDNYMRSVLHWTDTWEVMATGYTVGMIAPFLSPFSPTGLYLLIVFLEEYADFTRGRWVDVKPFEKNSIHRRKNFWGQYYTRTWTDNEYGTEEKAWDDNTYYLSNQAQPDFWYDDINLPWPYHPKNSSNSPADRRYSLMEKKTVSRYNYPGLQTYWILDGGDGNVDISNESIPSDLFEDGNIVIGENVTLIIDPSNTNDGIELLFDPDQYFKVRGSLIILGTEEKPVMLTSEIWAPEDDEMWGGLTFGSAQPENGNLGDSELNYTTIRSAIKKNNGNGGGVRINNRSDLYLDRYCEVIFNHCSFIDCKAEGSGGAVKIDVPSDNCDRDLLRVEFNECVFLCNRADYGGAVFSSVLSRHN
ncbi:MAG: hypothetical protein K9M99_00925 [Candidatus Cloacimonetes bacterium]|nr:hypothetical protein [Candidatus Cloacimonadota bacterium]